MEVRASAEQAGPCTRRSLYAGVFARHAFSRSFAARGRARVAQLVAIKLKHTL